MTRSLLILMVLASTANADGFGYRGPCDDVETCEVACANDAASCTWGGHYLLRSGLTVPDNRARAGKFYEQGCAKGDAEGCWRAGLLADPGFGDGKNDRRKARAFYDKACSKKLVRACYSLAKLDGASGDEKARKQADADYERGLAVETAACQRKDAAACERAITLARTSMSKPDDKRLAKLQDLACVARTGSPCPPPPPPPKCDDAQIANAAQKAANEANDRRYADALAKQSMQPIQLVEQRFQVDPYTRRAQKQPWRFDSVVDITTPDGRQVKAVVGATTESYAAQRPGDFARSGDNIYAITRVPNVLSRKSFMQCGHPPNCPGGARPPVMSTTYELPAGTTFAGRIKVSYDEDQVSFSYTAQCPALP